jgi:hypothetical protein
LAILSRIAPRRMPPVAVAQYECQALRAQRHNRCNNIKIHATSSKFAQQRFRLCAIRKLETDAKAEIKLR